MNYFEFYAGDYQRDTADLSLAEHGAFLMLLSTYYSTERPIPAGNPTLFRLVRAMTDEEQIAAISVADRFFPINPSDGMRHNARADHEIVKARIRIDIAKENGKKGGRPSKPKETRRDTQRDSEEEPVGIPTGKALHTPCSTLKDQKLSNPNGLEVIASADDLPSQGLAEPTNGVSHADRTPIQAIVAMYHAKLPNCRKCEKITPARAGYIRQRWREDLPTIEAWGNFFDYASQSAFLMGRTPGRDGKPPFVADLEFLTKPSSFVKIAEGKYHQ